MHVYSCSPILSSGFSEQDDRKKENKVSLELLYNQAKNNGMDYVTITDTNSIDRVVELHMNHPKDTFLGIELISKFPEHSCAIHILIYGLDEYIFNELLKVSTNIYLVRKLIKKNKLAYAVAHTPEFHNGKMVPAVVEKLILLFDVFEGSRREFTQSQNEAWGNMFQNVTLQQMKKLRSKYGIRPFSLHSVRKGFIGGSGNVAGNHIGLSYTLAEAYNVNSFLRSIVAKQCVAGLDDVDISRAD